MNRSEHSLRAFLAAALWLWTAVTAIIGLCSLALYLSMGPREFAALVQTGPLSIREQTLFSVAIAWLSWGIALVLVRRAKLDPERCIEVMCSVLILVLYVNILRERMKYGDVGDYIRAAFALHDGNPFHARYVYPPLLATLCQPFLWLGRDGLGWVFWFANLASLIAFFWLLKAVLVRYGFGQRLSLVIVFTFMVVNVPILRTLAWVQINLHVVNLILLTILLFPRYRILSAVALAVAANLKVSPLILALPFFWTRDWKWIASFLVSMVGLASVTGLFYGWSPFMDLFDNARDIYSANRISFRENSVDSFIRSTASLSGFEVQRAAVLAFKIPILILVFLTAIYNARHATFVRAKEDGSSILNSIPALLALMLLASPLVWEHHAVFVALPFLLITKKLDTASAWAWYCFAYALEYLAPTFDFYPWSFGRLISPVIVVFLMFRYGRLGDGGLFASLRSRLDDLSWERQPVTSTGAKKRRR